MADLLAHVEQSKHNKRIANALLKDPICRDWAVTAAFYSALHRAQAGFVFLSEKLPEDQTGGGNVHTRRQNMVRRCFGNTCFLKYRLLRETSNNVRYIPGYNGSTNPPSHCYVDHATAQVMLDQDLQTIYNEIIKVAPGAKD